MGLIKAGNRMKHLLYEHLASRESSFEIMLVGYFLRQPNGEFKGPSQNSRGSSNGLRARLTSLCMAGLDLTGRAPIGDPIAKVFLSDFSSTLRAWLSGLQMNAKIVAVTRRTNSSAIIFLNATE